MKFNSKLEKKNCPSKKKWYKKLKPMNRLKYIHYFILLLKQTVLVRRKILHHLFIEGIGICDV